MLTRYRVALVLVALPCAATASPSTLDEPTFLKRVVQAPRTRALGERVHAARAAIDATAPHALSLSYEREAVPGVDAHEDFVRLGWSFDLTGRRGFTQDAARAGADAERAGADYAGLAIQLEARLAFLDAIYAREHVARLDDARTALAAIVDSLRTRSTGGDASGYDFDRSTLELELLDDERATARRELEVARLRLGAFIGEPSTPFDASGSLLLPTQPVIASATTRPDIEAIRAHERQANVEVAAAKRMWLPRLDLLAGMIATSASDDPGYIVGVELEVPVFGRGAAHEAKARAEAKRWRSEADALSTEVTAEIEQARRDLALRIEQAEAYAAGPVKRVLDLQKRATVAYREGDRTILELLDVQRNARQASVHALKLVYEARRAELALARALGRTP